MTSILTADLNTLRNILNDLEVRLRNIYISSYEKKHLFTLQAQVTNEITLHNLNITYSNCPHKTTNDMCDITNGPCKANSIGKELDICQRNRLKHKNEVV